MLSFSDRTKRRKVSQSVRTLLSGIRVGNSLGHNSVTTNSVRVLESNHSLVESEANSETSADQEELSSQEIASPPDPLIILGSSVHESNSELQNARDLLVNWSISHNISHVALKDLLSILNKTSPELDLPLDPRTLLSTPRKITKLKIGNGEYCHFGLRSHIFSNLPIDSIKTLPLPNVSWLQNLENLITVTIGIDGVPICESNNNQFWPILGSVDGSRSSVPFVIGLFFGNTKPTSVVEFLEPLVLELIELETHGLHYSGITYNVRVRCVIADAPARSFLKCSNNFNSYYGCERCDQKGNWLGRVVFLKTNAPARTDNIQFPSNHFQGSSPLSRINLGLVSQFPLDYMHLVCLGVMRKFLFVWAKGKIPFKLSSASVFRISEKLLSFKPYMPKEFARRPRSLAELEHFKATEYRQFLLYTGPIALKGILDEHKYKHFLLLSTAVYILLRESNPEEWVVFAERLLVEFVLKSQSLYCKEFSIYNVHSLVHLATDYRNFGSLDNISAFKFENHMQIIKKLIRGSNNQLSQVSNRLAERQANNVIFSSPIQTQSGNFIRLKCGCWSSKEADSYFVTNGGHVIRIETINLDNKVCKAYKYLVRQPVPFYPCSSDKFGVLLVKKTAVKLVNVDLDTVKVKCVSLPFDKDFLFVIPMVHCLNE